MAANDHRYTGLNEVTLVEQVKRMQAPVVQHRGFARHGCIQKGTARWRQCTVPTNSTYDLQPTLTTNFEVARSLHLVAIQHKGSCQNAVYLHSQRVDRQSAVDQLPSAPTPTIPCHMCLCRVDSFPVQQIPRTNSLSLSLFLSLSLSLTLCRSFSLSLSRSLLGTGGVQRPPGRGPTMLSGSVVTRPGRGKMTLQVKL